MSKLENLKFQSLVEKIIDKKENDKKFNTLLWVLAIIGVVVVVALIAYAVYRHMQPDYLDDFEDEFEDDFDDALEDIFEDEGAN
ncbi:MAG: DUF4366 domain-containing protein [Lachnospiraceae bacterium]|nr:DUF4366 domain-containing protein [Lachnospiraceae bacterium]